MTYVYILRSINVPDQIYIGWTTDLRDRLQTHNSGRSIHTSKYRPWRIVFYAAFESKEKAIQFERYLKSNLRSASGATVGRPTFWQ
ncbi:MAG: GIY-YIG nuclease family protein, partial [Verrucomicrobia bacterium]|nr:GIY-YIG nuclease family protein [Verrucomicrobiota bacterium]